WYKILVKWKPVFWICFFPVVMVFVGAWVTTKRFFASLSTMLAVTYRFSDAGVEVESSGGNPRRDWSAFRHARENKASFLLYGTDGQKRVIPKRCLVAWQEIQLLRELLHRHISSFRP